MSLHLAVRRSLSVLCASLMLSACGGELEEPIAETHGEQSSPGEAAMKPGAPGSDESLVDCFIYTCPRTGRTYSGPTDYAARHRCELNCGNFCTYTSNVCV
ncbi:hypothetical protein A176_004851 [Myxococcus hansupus]|uniref:Lipoprotein n=1 Tax=Pseudomyxococcus hansupus TaxID=1297742 RepID=A0A0H4WYQ4_9BACT|nr:hypothetical protein [Myxococcus hansupus]AKQ67939.1 hypothetical protein A176_004851 [Myxococcus hansupus]